jgi:small-conductance mechanosensitive channel/ABC-type branched-subunit amino acid transport system substrate-binding protein
MHHSRTESDAMKALLNLLRSEHKWKAFGLILLAVLLAGTVLSLITRVAFLRDDETTRPRLVVAGPPALAHGVDLFAENLNRQGGWKGRPLMVMAIDESPQAAQKAARDPSVVGVVGYTSAAGLAAALPAYTARKLPVVTPQYVAAPAPNVIGIGLDEREQARFVANYARNVVQQRLMYVIREEGTQADALVEPFLDVYRKFDTPVREVWTIGDGPAREQQIRATLAAVRDVDIGAVYLAVRPQLAARLVEGIRAGGNAIEIFGPEQLATGDFGAALRQAGARDPAVLSHGIVAATPVLFDTANDEAQRFQTRYQQKFGASPDWQATLAHDAARVALAPGQDEVKGIAGSLRIAERRGQLPIQIGRYNGERLISAPVQLLPIAKGASFNYIDALRQGRVLYVNDRFMFKSNVVYVGVRVNEIADLDMQKETATVDMSVWFRYRGSFKPEDLLIQNAVEPVKFDTLEESKASDDVQYRRYRIRPKLRLNFTDARRAYGQHIAGIAFRHKLLNRSNLQYVADVLGMPTGEALVGDLARRRVLSAASGWEIDNAWLAQETVREQGDGAPQYVDLTGEQPQFSKITLGILIRPATATARDLIPGEYFIYLAIFGVLGSGTAVALDRRRGHRYWALQTWLLCLIFWPLLLLSVGNLVLDFAFTAFSPSTTRLYVNVYESLWWVVGAILLDMAVRRFLWHTLEARTGRRVPNVIKIFASLIVALLALACITAFVFNQTLTSLLATSGVMAMVIGLAVQANIANVFSGIVLNIERPFRVGDKVKINNISGKVIDINWRTTRIEASEGQLVCLANSKVSEAEMQNFSAAPNGFSVELPFFFSPVLDPQAVLDVLKQVVGGVPDALNPGAGFRGVVSKDGLWVAEYSVRYRVAQSGHKDGTREAIWLGVRGAFLERGWELNPAPAGAAA